MGEQASGFSRSDAQRIARAVRKVERLASPTLGGGTDARRMTLGSGFQVVTVSVYGGAAGDDTTECGYTYNWTDPAGTAHTNESPICSVHAALGPFVAANNGTCTFQSGEWKLFWVDEQPVVAPCAED